MRHPRHLGERQQRLIRHEQHRQGRRFARPVDVIHAAARSGDVGRMQDAEADAVLQEGGLRDAIHAEADRPIRFACDFAVPDEVDVILAVFHVVADAERVSLNIHDHVRHDVGHRAPIPVARGDVDAPQHLTAAQLDGAQVAAFPDQTERAGTQRDALGERLIRAVAQDACW